MNRSAGYLESSSDISNITVPTEEEDDLEKIMSIVVISTADLANSLKEVLLEYHKSQRVPYKLYVHISEEVNLEFCDRTLHVDYFVILADPRRTDVADKVKEDLLRISPVFLATSRCVVAVSWPEGVLPHMVATCSSEVHEVCRAKMLHKLVQQDDGPGGKKHLADRLLRLARTARGFNATAVPNVTGAFNPGPFWESAVAEATAAITAMLQSDDEEAEEDDDV